MSQRTGKYLVCIILFCIPVLVLAVSQWEIPILTKVWKYEETQPALALYDEFQSLLDQKRQNPQMLIFKKQNTENDQDLGQTDCNFIRSQVAKTRVDHSLTMLPGQENFAADVICLVNEKRIESGLEPYLWNQELQRLAEEHAEDMGANLKDISHISSEGKDITARMEAVSYNYSLAGENVASQMSSPDEVMTQWMNSNLHRSNILDSEFEDIGVGVYTDQDGVVYWTQIFGTEF